MTEKEVRVSIVYHSGFGHTTKVAEAVQQGSLSVTATVVSLIPVAEVESHWETLNQSQAIIFGSPTYMGGPSAAFAEFKDKTSKIWAERKWQDKIAGGFTNSGAWSGDKLNTLQAFQILAMQHGMIWVGLDLMPGYCKSDSTLDELNRVGIWVGVGTQSNVDQGADQAPYNSDLKTAEHYGQRIAMAAKRWNGIKN